MSEEFMKSALDRAMERADQIEVPEEKLKEMKYRSEGERLAAEFLKESEYDLDGALGKLDPEAGKYISKTVETTFLQNLRLPKKDSDMARNDKAFEGLVALKKDKNGVQQAKEQLGNLSNYYVQAVKQNYDQLRAELEQAMSQALQQRMGPDAPMNINVEQSPEFQENWRQLSANLDAQYEQALTQLKEQIAALR